MNSLFYRLADQAIRERQVDVKSNYTPIFPNQMEVNFEENNNSVKESEFLNRNIQIDHKKNNNKEEISNIDFPNKENITKNTLNQEVLQPASVPFSQSLQSNEHQQSSSEASHDYAIKPIQTNSVTAIQRDKEKNDTDTVIDKTELSHSDDSSILSPVSLTKDKKLKREGSQEILPQSLQRKYKAIGSLQGGKQYSPVTSKKHRQTFVEPQETVINVSIGRIEVKTSSTENSSTKSKIKKSNRKPSVSLDDYQRNRQRGHQ